MLRFQSKTHLLSGERFVVGIYMVLVQRGSSEGSCGEAAPGGAISDGGDTVRSAPSLPCSRGSGLLAGPPGFQPPSTSANWPELAAPHAHGAPGAHSLVRQKMPLGFPLSSPCGGAAPGGASAGLPPEEERNAVDGRAAQGLLVQGRLGTKPRTRVQARAPAHGRGLPSTTLLSPLLSQVLESWPGSGITAVSVFLLGCLLPS